MQDVLVGPGQRTRNLSQDGEWQEKVRLVLTRLSEYERRWVAALLSERSAGVEKRSLRRLQLTTSSTSVPRSGDSAGRVAYIENPYDCSRYRNVGEGGERGRGARLRVS